VKGEQLVDWLSKSFREDKSEEGGGHVLAGFDGAYGLACDAGQGGQLLLRQVSFCAGDFEPVIEAWGGDFVSLGLRLQDKETVQKCQVYLAKRQLYLTYGQV
jgi:hypothetical protein